MRRNKTGRADTTTADDAEGQSVEDPIGAVKFHETFSLSASRGDDPPKEWTPFGGYMQTRNVLTAFDHPELEVDIEAHAQCRGWTITRASGGTDLIAMPYFAAVVDRRIDNGDLWKEYESLLRESGYVHAGHLITIDPDDGPDQMYSRCRPDDPTDRQQLCDLLDSLHLALVNTRLRKLYEERMPRINDLRCSDPSVSSPFLLKVPTGYERAARKVMVVGPHPWGWSWKTCLDMDVDWLMDASHRFRYGRTGSHAQFRNAARQLYSMICPDGPEEGFVLNHLVKVERKGRRPPQPVEDQAAEWLQFEEELLIVQPETVVFFTGPAYDNRLRSCFRRFRPMETVSIEPISSRTARLGHYDLPELSFRTCNPDRTDEDTMRVEMELIAGIVKRAAG